MLRHLASKAKRKLATAVQPVGPGDHEGFGQHFDSEFYLSTYADVRGSGIGPANHYRHHGWREGRDPSPHFSTRFYLKTNPDLVDGDVDPLSHWIAQGCRQPVSEGELEAQLVDRLKQLVDPDVYLATFGDVMRSGMDPYLHLIEHGLAENRLTSAGFFSRELSFEGDSRKSSTDLDLLISGEPLRSFDEVAPLAGLDPNIAGPPPITTVGVVRYENTGHELGRLLRSLSYSTTVDHVHILDNSARPLAPTEIRALEEDSPVAVDYTHTPSNIGFGRGHNELMSQAFDGGADLYLGANPDGYFLPRAIDLAIEEWRHWDDVGLMDLLTEPMTHPKWYDPETGITAWCSGVAFLIGRKGFAATAGFDPDFPMYGEDVDLSFRIRTAGLTCRSALRAYFHHDVTPRFSRSDDYRRPLALAGNWYLLRKWEQGARADEVESLIRDSFGPEALPDPPPATCRPTDEIERNFELPRFAHSRFL